VDPLTENDASAFFADCRGRLLRRSQFLYLGVTDTLVTAVMWGAVAVDAMEEWVAVLAASHKVAIKRDVLLQMQHVTSIEEQALRRIATFVRDTRVQGAAVTAREAIVRPSETMGMVIAGFYDVIPPPYPVRACATVAEALDWLGVTDRQFLLDYSAPSDALHQKLVTYCAAHLADASLTDAAHDLGVARRTLQRRLASAGIHFAAVLTRARLQAAKTLLLRTRHDIKRVALEVGFATPSRLSQVFRDFEGTTPTAWRAKYSVR